MKKIFSLITMISCIAFSSMAFTYEDAFESIKAMPHMKGVEGTMISGDNDFVSLGINNARVIVWDGETSFDKETEIYGNEIYKLIGELPVNEMIQGRMSGSSIFAIFAKPLSENSYQILFLSDSAGAGFTGALIGRIDDKHLEALRQAILTPSEGGGTSIYLKAFNF